MHLSKKTIVISLILLFAINVVIASAATRTVSPTGSNDQVQINSALSSANSEGGGTVYLNSGVYSISGQVRIGSNTVLTGASTAILRVDPTSGAWYSPSVGVIGPLTTPIHDSIITGFQIDGNCENLPQSYSTDGVYGNDKEMLICFMGDSGTHYTNISVSNMQLYDAYSDGFRIQFGSGIQFYSNYVSNCEHDGVFYSDISGSNNFIYNNTIYGISDGCVRVDNCQHTVIWNNSFHSYDGDHNGQGQWKAKHGENGIQVGGKGGGRQLTQEIEIYNNYFYNGLAGIFFDDYGTPGTTSQNVYIHHNTFYRCGFYSNADHGGGVSVDLWGNTVYVENNTFDSCYQQSSQTLQVVSGGPFNMIVYENNFINQRGHGNATSGGNQIAGYGVGNFRVTSTGMQMQIDSNYFNNNTNSAGGLGNLYPVNLGHTNDLPVSNPNAGGGGSGGTNPTTTVAGTQIILHGIIFDTSTDNPISGAAVTLWNDTWSGVVTTTSDGVYQFPMISNTGTYYLKASVTYYMDSLTMPITPTNTYISQNIAMVKSPSFFPPHYTNFYIMSSWLGSPVTGAIVNIYDQGNDPATGVPDMTAVADDNGEVTFAMSQDHQYTVVVNYMGVTDTETITGNHDSYYIYMNAVGWGQIFPKQFDEYIHVNVSAVPFSDSQAYINVSYYDDLASTNTIQFNLSQKDPNGTFVYMDSSPYYDASNPLGNNTTYAVNYSFIVGNYIGEEYNIELTENNTYFGEITRDYPVRFPGSNIPYTDNIILAFLSLVLVFTIGAQFRAGEHASGACVVCGFAWFLWILGCYQAFGFWWNYLIGAGLLVASANAVIALINDVKD